MLLPGLLWARAPALFVVVALLYGAFERRRTHVDPVLHALVTARVAQINRCRFCMDINAFLRTRRTGSVEKAEALAGWCGSDLFSEKAVLEYVEAITCTERQVDGDMMEPLRQFFDEDAIVELMGLVAFRSSPANSTARRMCRPRGSARGHPQIRRNPRPKLNQVRNDSSGLA